MRYEISPVRALLGWWVRSWRRPAGDSLAWEQRAGHDTHQGTGAGKEDEGRKTTDEGTRDQGHNRHQNVKQTGAGS